MIKYLLTAALICAAVPAYAYTDLEIVNAIGRVENSIKYPYGVKSIGCHGNVDKARQICFNSVRNSRGRWYAAGCPGDLITFIGLRYAPPTTNPNWVRLVKYYLKYP